MKIFPSILAVVAFVGNASAGEPEVFAPPANPAERYRSVWEKSPFVAETPATAQKQGPGLSQRFVLAGMATLNDEPLIFVLDRQSLARIVVTKKSGAAGLQLVSIDSNTDPKQASATVRLGAEQDVIRYDLAALQSVTQSADQSEAKSPSPVPSATPEGVLPISSGTKPQNSPAPPRPARVIKRPINLKPSNS